MNKTILERIKKENYVTDYPTTTSGYLLKDGTYVHLVAKLDEDCGAWYRDDHRVISHFMNSMKNDDSSGNDAMKRFVKNGNIRFSPECNGFQFIKKPTREQIKEIISYCSHVRRNQKEYYIEKVNDNFVVTKEYDIEDLRELLYR